jgi:hypothetical protein
MYAAEAKYLATDGPLVVLTQVHARARATGRELDMGVSRKCARSTGTPP